MNSMVLAQKQLTILQDFELNFMTKHDFMKVLDIETELFIEERFLTVAKIFIRDWEIGKEVRGGTKPSGIYTGTHKITIIPSKFK